MCINIYLYQRRKDALWVSHSAALLESELFNAQLDLEWSWSLAYRVFLLSNFVVQVKKCNLQFFFIWMKLNLRPVKCYTVKINNIPHLMRNINSHEYTVCSIWKSNKRSDNRIYLIWNTRYYWQHILWVL